MGKYRTGYAETLEFDCVVVFMILIVIPLAILMMQSRKSKIKRTVAFVLLAASFLYLIAFEGVMRISDRDRVKALGIKGTLYPEFVIKKFSESIAIDDDDYSQEVWRNERERETRKLQYFSLSDAPNENENVFREDMIYRSSMLDKEKATTTKTLKSSRPVIVHVEQRFSGGDVFFRDVFDEYENITGRKTNSGNLVDYTSDLGTLGTFIFEDLDDLETLTTLTTKRADFRAVFVIRDPRDVVATRYINALSTQEEWAREKRDDLNGESFQARLRKQNSEEAIDIEIARFLTASGYNIPYFSSLKNSAINIGGQSGGGKYAQLVMKIASKLSSSEDSTTIEAKVIFVKYEDLLSASEIGFHKLSEFLRGDSDFETALLKAALKLREQREQPFTLSSLINENDNDYYAKSNKEHHAHTQKQALILPLNIFKEKFSLKNSRNFCSIAQKYLRLLGIALDRNQRSSNSYDTDNNNNNNNETTQTRNDKIKTYFDIASMN